MLASLLTLGLGLIGRINDYLFPTDGAGPSANSKRKLEPPQILGRLLEHGPALSVRFLEIQFDLKRKRKSVG